MPGPSPPSCAQEQVQTAAKPHPRVAMVARTRSSASRPSPSNSRQLKLPHYLSLLPDLFMLSSEHRTILGFSSRRPFVPVYMAELEPHLQLHRPLRRLSSALELADGRAAVLRTLPCQGRRGGSDERERERESRANREEDNGER